MSAADNSATSPEPTSSAALIGSSDLLGRKPLLISVVLGLRRASAGTQMGALALTYQQANPEAAQAAAKGGRGEVGESETKECDRPRTPAERRTGIAAPRGTASQMERVQTRAARLSRRRGWSKTAKKSPSPAEWPEAQFSLCVPSP